MPELKRARRARFGWKRCSSTVSCVLGGNVLCKWLCGGGLVPFRASNFEVGMTSQGEV